jgi:hypothetical protein
MTITIRDTNVPNHCVHWPGELLAIFRLAPRAAER